MASVSSSHVRLPASSHRADPNPRVLPTQPPRFLSAPSCPPLPRLTRASPPPSKLSDSLLCRCRTPHSDSPFKGDDSGRSGWESLIHDVVQGVFKLLADRWNPSPKDRPKPAPDAAVAGKEEEKGEVAPKMEEGKKVKGNEKEDKWSWERWTRHFAEIEESERLVYVLKSELRAAVAREDYEDAKKLKLGIDIAAESDTVGKVISDLNRAVEEERYYDAAYIRDHAGTGLVGWWAGISGTDADPYGLIIHIGADYGKYVAKCYNSRQLALSSSGFPLFEIYFTEMNGEYKQQAVYMKPNSKDSGGLQDMPFEKYDIPSINPSDSSFGKEDRSNAGTNLNDAKDDNNDLASGLAGFENLSQDMVPVFRVKVLKVVSTGKIDKDYISNIIDQISEEDDDDNDVDLESTQVEDIRDENNSDETGVDSDEENSDASEDESEINGASFASVKEDALPKTLVRLPARLEQRDRVSFSFYVEQDDKQQESVRSKEVLQKKASMRSLQHGIDLLPDLAKMIGSKKKISIKILKIDGDRNNGRINQGLSGVTHFSRIGMPATSDPLCGLYIGASGLDSEVLSLQRKFGQWQEEKSSPEHMSLQFYEYVEAVKLIGDHLVPAGQTIFRAKVGKQNQLPHKGIIPKELGVVARYKGQGRVADPGFQNPRWVDGELLVLNGKFIRDGPVIALFYWARGFHLFEFFTRLKLPD